MRFAAATLLSFVASALAYQVTSPSETKGWTNQGPQTLTWTRVDTDKTNFTVLLTNENRAILPTNNQVLAALVDGTSQTTLSVNPPSGGWPLGSGFRVNLVQDEQNTNTIYAQSGQFNITTPTASSSSGLSSATHATGSTLVVSNTGATGATGTTVAGGASASETANTNPPGANGALTLGSSAGLSAGFAFLAYILA